MELIDEQGHKAALHGRGTKAGGHWSTDRLPETVTNVAICEGVADAITARMAGAELAVAAFSNSNLVKVAQEMHRLFPGAVLTVVADLEKDSGRPDQHAIAAARAVGGRLAVPNFGPERESHQKDINDLMAVFGLDAVRRCLAEALPVVDDPREQQQAQHQANDAGDADTLIEWPEPTPLPNALPPVQPFDLDLLPEALRGWIADISERMQCPQDFPATGAIVALSSLIGARAVVAPKAHDDWRVVPNLWGMVVGRPGVMKSPALGEVLKPLHGLEANEREVWQSAYESWELDCKVAEMATKQNEKSAAQLAAKNPAKARELLKPVEMKEEPKARRYVVNDSTVERMGELLESNPWGILSYRDEVHGLLCSLDRQGQEGARAFYLQAYDGNQGYTFDRIGRGTNYIPRVCLAMLGNIQPGRVQSYVRDAVAGGTGDDGLLQRFGVTVWPDVSREFVHVDRWPDTPAKQRALAVFVRLNQLQPATDTDPQEWRFSDGAQALFRDWLADPVRDGNPWR